jgi:hypothetical protein
MATRPATLPRKCPRPSWETKNTLYRYMEALGIPKKREE